MDAKKAVALGFEARLSEAKVWCLITDSYYLLLETDLEINTGEGSTQTEVTGLSKIGCNFASGGKCRRFDQM